MQLGDAVATHHELQRVPSKQVARSVPTRYFLYINRRMVGKSKTVATSTKQHRHHPQQQQQQPTIINKQPPSLSAEAGITKSKKKKQKKENSPPTPFQQRVYALCRCIPAGKVSTYGAMATALKSSPRAVGQALRCNPYAPEVPCHRVIAATLELGGFTGSWGAHCASVQKVRFFS